MTGNRGACICIAASMRQFLLLGCAALLLAGCATPYPSDPYGQAQYPGQYPGDPYPPSGPYPGDSYPPSGPYPQSGPYPPSAPYAPSGGYPPGPGSSLELRCPISTSSNWQAVVNAMPGPNSGPKLVVTGKVITASPGYHIEFDPKLQIRRGYPVQAFATLIVTPPAAGVPQALYSQEVHWEWPMREPIGAVEIRCGSETLATISPVQSAY